MSAEIYVCTVNDDDTLYPHWAEGTKCFIAKDDIEITLDSEELQDLVRQLPRTISGKY